MIEPESQLVLGEIRGYRAWQFAAHRGGWYNQPLNRAKLLPLTMSSLPMLPKAPKDPYYTAICAATPSHADLSEPAPGLNCECGFYALYGKDALTKLITQYIGVPYVHMGIMVVAAVTLKGRVIQGSTGVMRGQHLRIEAFLKPPARYLNFDCGINELGKAYDVPVQPVMEFASSDAEHVWIESECLRYEYGLVRSWLAEGSPARRYDVACRFHSYGDPDIGDCTYGTWTGVRSIESVRGSLDNDRSYWH